MSDVDLAYLRFHWQDAYWIVRRNGRFEAERRDDRAVIHAATEWELLELIRLDYQARPVPRQ